MITFCFKGKKSNTGLSTSKSTRTISDLEELVSSKVTDPRSSEEHILLKFNDLDPSRRKLMNIMSKFGVHNAESHDKRPEPPPSTASSSSLTNPFASTNSTQSTHTKRSRRSSSSARLIFDLIETTASIKNNRTFNTLLLCVCVCVISVRIQMLRMRRRQNWNM